MLHQILLANPSIERLKFEGYDLDFCDDGYLYAKGIPYLLSDNSMNFGTLAFAIDLVDPSRVSYEAKPPKDHACFLLGDKEPSNGNGGVITGVTEHSGQPPLGQCYQISRKSSGFTSYGNFYDKVTYCVSIINRPYQLKFSQGLYTHLNYGIAPEQQHMLPFLYKDDRSMQNGLSSISGKLKISNVAIIGLGGTGSHVLDNLVRLPIDYIHIFDGDELTASNAFRMPGAFSLDDVKQNIKKVRYFYEKYDRMRKGIIPYDIHICGSNLSLLDNVDFVFLAIDDGPSRKLIVEYLESKGKSFISLAMSLNIKDSSVAGGLSVIPSIKGVRAGDINFANLDEDNLYNSNIQIKDMNSLHADLAIIAFKKIHTYYCPDEGNVLVHRCRYVLDSNKILKAKNDA